MSTETLTHEVSSFLQTCLPVPFLIFIHQPLFTSHWSRCEAAGEVSPVLWQEFRQIQSVYCGICLDRIGTGVSYVFCFPQWSTLETRLIGHLLVSLSSSGRKSFWASCFSSDSTWTFRHRSLTEDWNPNRQSSAFTATWETAALPLLHHHHHLDQVCQPLANVLWMKQWKAAARCRGLWVTDTGFGSRLVGSKPSDLIPK